MFSNMSGFISDTSRLNSYKCTVLLRVQTHLKDIKMSIIQTNKDVWKKTEHTTIK